MEHVSSVRPTGKFLKRWSRFPGWNFRTECPVPFTFLVVCTSSRSTVGHRHVPGFTTKWNNFLPIGNSTFATTQISGGSILKREKRDVRLAFLAWGDFHVRSRFARSTIPESIAEEKWGLLVGMIVSGMPCFPCCNKVPYCDKFENARRFKYCTLKI